LPSFIGTIRDISLFAAVFFVSTKILRFGVITLNNSSGGDQLPYSVVFSNGGTFFSGVEARRLISAFVVAPLVETFIFCVLVWKICHRFRVGNRVFVSLSAVLFGLYHLTLSPYTALVSLIGGFLLAALFLRYQKYHVVIAFWVVALTHSLYNVSVALI
jgi:hypothetical protein